MKTIQVMKSSRTSSNSSVSEGVGEVLEGKCEDNTSCEKF